MSDERKCSACGLPISRDDVIRHAGYFVSHDPSRCITLLLYRNSDLTIARDEAVGKLVSVELERDAYKRESETAAKLAGQSFRELSSALGRLEDALKALEVAKCPNCDGSGGAPVRVSVDEWEQEQCQWCYEKFALLNDGSRVVERRIDNVRDFGAVGDGVTDDAPAFQRAIDACEACARDARNEPPALQYVHTCAARR